MEQIKLNHWYIIGNNFTIALPRYHVSIEPLALGKKAMFVLYVQDGAENASYYSFKSLEDAISFTENGIANCEKFSEIIDVYNEMYEVKKLSKKK